MNAITTTPDVNAEFDGIKAGQIADALNAMDNHADRIAALRVRENKGEIRVTDLGDAGHRVTMLTGWDANESFVIPIPNANGAIEIQMSHGLDTKANGDVAFYGTEPAWWSLGQEINPELKTAADILSAAGLAWRVEQAQNTFTAPDGTVRDIQNSFVNYRSDTFAPLGTVGKIYEPFQNLMAYGMLDELLQYDMVVRSAGSFRGGRKVFVTAEIPSHALVVGSNGVQDPVRQFLNLINTHDGNGCLVLAVSPWFIRCQNTARLAVKNAKSIHKIRHTRGGYKKIEEARRALGMTQAYFESFVAEESALANIAFDDNDLDKLINDVWADEIAKQDASDSKRGATIAKNRRDAIHEVWAVELGRLGATAFAGENAITGYLDHTSEVRPRGELKGNRLAALGQNLLEGTNEDRKSKAHQVLMNRVK